jgi:hypothetical protein
MGGSAGARAHRLGGGEQFHQRIGHRTGSPGEDSVWPRRKDLVGGDDAAHAAAPPLQENGLSPGSDLVDCEGETFDYSGPSVALPVAGQLGLSMNTRTLDFRKDADRPQSQSVTFT